MPTVPVVRDDDTAPFFDAAADDRLLVRRCAVGHFLAPAPFTLSFASQALHCPTCGSSDVTWVEASGIATLVTWTVVHARDAEPSVAGIIELEEGPWVYAGISADDPSTLTAGQPVDVTFLHPEEGEPVLVAVPRTTP